MQFFCEKLSLSFKGNMTSATHASNKSLICLLCVPDIPY